MRPEIPYTCLECRRRPPTGAWRPLAVLGALFVLEVVGALVGVERVVRAGAERPVIPDTTVICPAATPSPEPTP